MKLLYVTTGLDSGGAQMMLYNLLSRMDRDRFDPIVISLMGQGLWGDRIESLGVPVYPIGMKSGLPTPGAIWRLLRLVAQLNPDLIQGWMYHGNLAAQFVSSLFTSFKSRQIPVLWSIHYSIDALALDKKMTIALVKFGAYVSTLPKQVLFVSRVSQSQHEALGYASTNSHVIPNGFDTSRFLPSVIDRKTVRSELNFSENCVLIGIAGRYHPMKDHANFIQAAALLLETDPQVQFIMMGQGLTDDNPTLRELIQTLGIRDRIHLLGERQDMPRLLASLDVFTSASAYGEAFPMVIGEAMACEVPCVVTDVGDSGWMVGDTGKVVSPRSPEALAEAWKDLIDQSPEARNQLGKSARSRMISECSLNSIVAQYESLYDRILN
jgi:glycosyltransferase involved in cell wall biosynthesis